MGGDLESRCVVRLCGEDVAVLARVLYKGRFLEKMRLYSVNYTGRFIMYSGNTKRLL